MNIQPAASKIAEEIHGLNVMILAICAAIGVIVFGVMIYSMVKFRKSKGAVPVELEEDTKVRFLGKDWTVGPTTLEIGWTIIPFLIVIGMALPATKTMVAMKDTSNADLTIKVTGYQWKWGYEYMDGSARGVSFIANLATPREQINNLQTKSNDYLLKADQALVVPVGKKVRIVTTAADVIHAWMVPRLGVKIDAIPGIVRDAWFKADKEGMYYGQCVELCGKEHAFMPINVEVVSQEAFKKWSEDKRKKMAANADDPTKVYTMDELTSRGSAVLADADKAALDKVASDVATNPSSRVEVSGYVDSSGSADKNEELAKNLYDHTRRDYGVWCCDASICWVCQLFVAIANWRVRHGIPTDE
ncbi:unnamed protein product, partial [Darwinula stevensoni]